MTCLRFTIISLDKGGGKRSSNWPDSYGTVTVQSPLRRGTMVEVYLPLAVRKTPTLGQVRETAPHSRFPIW